MSDKNQPVLTIQWFGNCKQKNIENKKYYHVINLTSFPPNLMYFPKMTNEKITYQTFNNSPMVHLYQRNHEIFICEHATVDVILNFNYFNTLLWKAEIYRLNAATVHY